MKAPFYKVILVNKDKDRDISDIVENLAVDDTIEKDSMIEFNVKSDYAFDMADDPDLVAGKSIKVQFGFSGGLMSEVHEGRISDIEVTYAERIKLKIRAFDKGVSLKRIPSQKIWSNVTSSDIAKEIAGKYGLATDVQDTTHKWKSYAQGNKSDFDFLKELALKEDGFVFYVTSNSLRFEKRDFSKASVREFKYGDSEMIEFTPRLRESQQSGASNAAKGVAVNPMTKTTTKSGAKKDESVLGDFNLDMNIHMDLTDAGEKSLKESNKKVTNTNRGRATTPTDKSVKKENGKSLIDMIGEFFPMPGGGGAEDITKNLNGITGNKSKNAGLKVLEAGLKVEGNPTIKLNEVITISNVAKRYQGNWHITKINNSISAGSAYFTSITLSKNGTSKSTKNKGGKTTGKVNKTTGKKTVEATKEVEIVVLDATMGKKPKK